MTHYLGKLEERNGDYEYETTVKFKTYGEPYAYLRAVSRSWYGEPDDVQDDDSPGFYFNCGSVFVEAGGIQPISAATFEELTLIHEV